MGSVARPYPDSNFVSTQEVSYFKVNNIPINENTMADFPMQNINWPAELSDDFKDKLMTIA